VRDLLLGEEVEARVEARAEVVGEEELALDLVRGAVVRDVLEVERGIPGDLAPVGERVARLDLHAFVLGPDALDVVGIAVVLVEVELPSAAQAELDLALPEMVRPLATRRVHLEPL